MLDKLMEILKRSQTMDNEFGLAIKEFEVAASARDKDRMEAARVKVHELTDVKLDLINDINHMKEDSMNDVLNQLRNRPR